MARIVFISPYLKGGSNARRSNLLHYVATREGVELLQDEERSLPATKKQQEYIVRLVRAFPSAAELLEYEDYTTVPTRGSAHEFIEQVREQYIEPLDKRENFIDYVANRPGVQQLGEHGLWNAEGKVPVLAHAMREVAEHPGNVWTPVVSLRREDAERLGYADAENWRALVNATISDLASGYKIHPDHLRWYAAFHEKEKSVHIHMVIFSTDSKEGYLTKQGIRSIKSAFARQIYRQDLICIYEKQTEYRSTLQRDAQELMSELIHRMEHGTIHNETLEQLTAELAERLQCTSGKKVYGYLPPRVKRIVDEIVDELAKDERVARAYSLWQEMRDEVCRTYNKELPEHLPLSQQKEFKPVRNMVIREALKLSDMTFTYDDSTMEDETVEEDNGLEEPAPIAEGAGQAYSVYEQAERYRRAKKTLADEYAGKDEQADARAMLEKLWGEGYSTAAHLLGKLYRDGISVPTDKKQAELWFRRSVEAGNDYSQYALGKLLMEKGDTKNGIVWLKLAAEQNNQYAQYRLGKIYLDGANVPKDMDAALEYLNASAKLGNQYAQYTLGKLYLLGHGVKRDVDVAVDWLTRSATQGNAYAQFFLDHKDRLQRASVGGAVLRMLHHMGNIFRENSAKGESYTGMQIDRKRREALQEKRLAMGHKADDHEDRVQQQTL